jgi:uncharacterized membrane protein YqhA
MSRILNGTRYLVVIRVLGLAIAASVFFIFSGIGLIDLLIKIIQAVITSTGFTAVENERGLLIFEVVEYVHLFLVGTVLYITAIGLYQLFVHEIKFPNWLKIDSTEELETNLIGITVGVLAVNFKGALFVGNKETLLDSVGGSLYRSPPGVIYRAAGLGYQSKQRNRC